MAITTPVIHVDILPTFAELAEAQLPDQALDGISLVPVFRHPETRLERDALYHHFSGYLESYVHPDGWRTGPVSVIRAGDMKLLYFYEDDLPSFTMSRMTLGSRMILPRPCRTRSRHGGSSWRIG